MNKDNKAGATTARPGDIVEYSDMANIIPCSWEVLSTPADIVPDGTMWQDLSAFQLVNPSTGDTTTSDLRQHGWRIVRTAVTL